MPMALTILLWLSSPLIWLMVMTMIAGWSQVSRKPGTNPEYAARIVKVGPTTPQGVGAALMFLSMAYRPNHSFVAKAQIVQREDEDEDDQGGGQDTPQRHLKRQLRRIRRGET